MAKLFVRALRTGALLAALCGTAVVAAQDSRSSGGVRNVGQAAKPATLNEALGRLAARPQDIDALLDASNAALELGDVEAAIGFLTRADAVSPRNPRVKGMIGSALVRNENPYEAIGYFDQAEAAGADVAKLASDRGLAYDLVGDQVTAQSFYRIAIARSPSEELTRRYALSLAVGGDKRTADQVLSPLIQRQDPAAWRTRPFILAITGNQDEAISIANSMMPKHLADGIAPYLRYMPRLTAAQQIAAATFGKFPRAADIGRDDPRAARFVKSSPRSAGTQIAQAPSGAAKPAVSAPASKSAAAKVAAPAPVAPVRTAPPPVDPATSAPAAQVAVGPALASAPSVQPPVSAEPAPATPAAAPAPVQEPARVAVVNAVSAPTLSFESTSSPTQEAGAVEHAAAAPPPAAAFDFSAAFGDFRPPADEKQDVAAVDITRLPAAAPRSTAKPAETSPAKAPAKAAEEKPAKLAASMATAAKNTRGGAAAPAADTPAKGVKGKTDKVDAKTAKADPKTADAKSAKTDPKADPKAAKSDKKTAAAEKASAKGKKAKEPRNPSRVWVQVSTGGNKADLPKDWRRIATKAGAVLRGKKAYTTPWRNNFRLLTGPFPTDAAAQTFVNQLRREGVSAFSWSSEDGQAVDVLATGK